MRGDRTTDRDALVNRYGLSMRMAARVVALLSKRIDVSETLLELAASDPGQVGKIALQTTLRGPADLDRFSSP